MKNQSMFGLLITLITFSIDCFDGFTNDTWHQCLIPDYWSTEWNCSQWTPFIPRDSLTTTQNDFNGLESWRTVMWFTDDIWSGTLADYQAILQQSFVYATMDIHEKWGAENLTNIYEDFTTDDFYVNVTFFLGFCLLQDKECDIIKESDLKTYATAGEIVGDRELGDYYVYSVIYAKEEYVRYIHDLLETFSHDYMAYTSMRLQCSEFRELLNASESENADETADLKFKAWAYYVSPLKVEVPWVVPEILNWCVIGFVCFCVVFAIAGAIHGFGIWGADCIRISGIIYFGLYTWDFYSDIVFTLSLWDCEECPSTLFYAAAVFVVIPWIANMIALSRYQNKWCKDETIRERVYQWFVSWQRLTYALAALSGSAFGTVELANSYVFGLDFFCMGLNERHLKKFNNNRLYSSILVENAPQICIQLLFFQVVGWDQILQDDSRPALMALSASILSVGAALLDIYASKKLFSVLKQDGEYVGKTSCSIFVISSEIKQNATRLQVSTYAFRDAIAETLSTHPRSVEMHFPIATSTGFKMKFTIFSSKLTPQVIYKAIKQGSESKLPKRIQQVWRLTKPVVIPTDRIEVERVANQSEEGAVISSSDGNGVEGTQIMGSENATTNVGNAMPITLASSSQSHLDQNAAPIQTIVELPPAQARPKETEGS